MESQQGNINIGRNSPDDKDLTSLSQSRHKNLPVYISHKNDKESECYVQGLCNALEQKKIKYVIDTRDAAYRMKLQEFEEKIANGQLVAAIIDLAYLKSIECMYELAKVSENGHMEKRLFPLIIIDIDRSAKGLISQIEYWNLELDGLTKDARTLGPGNNNICIHDITRINTILQQLPKIWIYFKEYLTSTKEQLIANNYALMISSIKEQLNKAYNLY